jgi:DNA-3-methyladenine glycosylase I
MEQQRPRCRWAASPIMVAYHDTEWGRPCRDDRRLFEMLTLEGAQAGLSWETVLRKREGYRAAFAGFEITAVAAFGEADVARCLADPGIIRHRGKIESTIGNARAVLAIQAAQGSFAGWLWRFAGDRPVVTRRIPGEAAPSFTPLAAEVSKALKKAGFRFVGPTIVQSFLQAAGVLDDHEATCFCATAPAASPAPPPAAG